MGLTVLGCSVRFFSVIYLVYLVTLWSRRSYWLLAILLISKFRGPQKTVGPSDSVNCSLQTGSTPSINDKYVLPMSRGLLLSPWTPPQFLGLQPLLCIICWTKIQVLHLASWILEMLHGRVFMYYRWYWSLNPHETTQCIHIADINYWPITAFMSHWMTELIKDLNQWQ